MDEQINRITDLLYKCQQEKLVALEDLAECQQQRDRLAEVEAAARIIFDATVIAPGRKCPHGIAPSYPTHAWWCDDCFGRLEAALGVQDE